MERMTGHQLSAQIAEMLALSNEVTSPDDELDEEVVIASARRRAGLSGEESQESRGDDFAPALQNDREIDVDIQTGQCLKLHAFKIFYKTT